jgi:hypothetical protein
MVLPIWEMVLLRPTTTLTFTPASAKARASRRVCHMSFDSVPMWAVLLATIGLVFLALDIGFRLGKRRLQGSQGKLEVSGAMVGAAMGLLAFMLAFTFNGAAGRHDARKTIVIEEANAIYMTWLRAGLMAAPYRADVRAMLRDYVDVSAVIPIAGECSVARLLMGIVLNPCQGSVSFCLELDVIFNNHVKLNRHIDIDPAPEYV